MLEDSFRIIRAVIFDEAHELEEVATEYFGFHVSNFRIGELVGDAKRLSEKSETEMDDLTSVQRAADRFFGGMAMTTEGRHPVQSFREFEGMDALIGALHDARHSLKKQKDFSGEWETLERRTGEIQSELEVLRNGNLENYVSWVERRGRGLFLEACPVDVSGLLRERLFERIPACVLTSATLTVAESFGYFRQRIGMEVGEELSLATEFDVRTQTMLYVPSRMPDYRHPSYLNRAVQEIKSILSASRGQSIRAVHKLSADDGGVRHCLPGSAVAVPGPDPKRGKEPPARRVQDHTERGIVCHIELLAGYRCEGRRFECSDYRQVAVSGAFGSARERANGSS